MFQGFNKKKRSSIGGDFDGDGVKNRKDCRPLNHKKQDGPWCSNCGKKMPKHRADYGECEDCVKSYDDSYKEDHFGVSQEVYEGYFG